MAEFEIIGRNDDHAGQAVASFEDGSSVRVEWFGVEAEEGAELSRFPLATWSRQVYRFVVTDAAQLVIEDGKLYTACGVPINVLRALGSWCNFALADAETYAGSMAGTASQEWAYMNHEELHFLFLSAHK